MKPRALGFLVAAGLLAAADGRAEEKKGGKDSI